MNLIFNLRNHGKPLLFEKSKLCKQKTPPLFRETGFRTVSHNNLTGGYGSFFIVKLESLYKFIADGFKKRRYHHLSRDANAIGPDTTGHAYRTITPCGDHRKWGLWRGRSASRRIIAKQGSFYSKAVRNWNAKLRKIRANPNCLPISASIVSHRNAMQPDINQDLKMLSEQRYALKFFKFIVIRGPLQDINRNEL